MKQFYIFCEEGITLLGFFCFVFIREKLKAMEQAEVFSLWENHVLATHFWESDGKCYSVTHSFPIKREQFNIDSTFLLGFGIMG